MRRDGSGKLTQSQVVLTADRNGTIGHDADSPEVVASLAR